MMQNLLAFMSAFKDNFYFVLFVAVLCGMVVALRGFAAIRRSQTLEHQRTVERMHIDASKAIVPITPRKDDY